MAIYRQYADHGWEFADSADFEFGESTDNLPIFARNLSILARGELRNPSTIRRNPSIRLSEPERRIVRYSSDDLWETSDSVARGTSRRPAES